MLDDDREDLDDDDMSYNTDDLIDNADAEDADIFEMLGEFNCPAVSIPEQAASDSPPGPVLPLCSAGQSEAANLEASPLRLSTCSHMAVLAHRFLKICTWKAQIASHPMVPYGHPLVLNAIGRWHIGLRCVGQHHQPQRIYLQSLR